MGIRSMTHSVGFYEVFDCYFSNLWCFFSSAVTVFCINKTTPFLLLLNVIVFNLFCYMKVAQ